MHQKHIFIDWARVSEKLVCPICGEKAYIVEGTDGTQGSHTHTFDITREHARCLSLGDPDEIKAKIASLQKELEAAEAVEGETT